MNDIQLMYYNAIGGRIVESGEKLLIDDKFKDGDRALCLLHDDSTGALLLNIISGILNLDGTTILLLESANPEDMEDTENLAYFIVRLLSPTCVEIVEEQFVERIRELVIDAVKLDRKVNLARVESIFGTLRVFEHGKETVPYSK